MSGKWWTIVSLVVAAKIYFLGSWLWGAPDDALAHAAEPAKVVEDEAVLAAKAAAANAVPVQTKPDAARDAALDDAAEKAHEASSAAGAKEDAFAGQTSGAAGLGAARGKDITTKASDVNAATPRACLAALRAVREERVSHDKKAATLLVREREVEGRERAAKKLLADALVLSKRAEAALATAVSERKQGRGERTLRLAKLLGVMKPLEAAGVVARLAIRNAVAALAQMETARAGKILGALPPEIAAAISESLLVQPKQAEVVKAAAPATPAARAPAAKTTGGAAASQ